MEYLVGIDIGSTTLKGVVYDLEGNVIASGARPTERHHPTPAHPDWVTWDPDQIWDGVASAVREAVSALEDPRGIRGVSVSGLGMDGLPVDRDGRALYPFISWLCPRTAPQLDWWESEIGAARTFSIGGNTLWRHSTALRIRWMAENEPGILARADKWLLIEDFINLRLCGARATDYSMASCTLLFDQAARAWSNEMLGRAAIDRGLLCEPAPSGTVLGEVTEDAAGATGIPRGTPVVLGGHDYLCGALPVGVTAEGAWLDVSGTWEIVLTPIPVPVLTPALQRTGVTVECHVARDMYSAMGSAVSAEMLEWYRREYGLEARREASVRGCSDWECLMEEARRSPPGSRGAMFLPHMGGAGCPAVDPRSLGGFVGLSVDSTRGDILRSLIEGLDFQLRDIVTAMEENLGTSPSRFVVVGGAARNPFWMQNKADVLGRMVETPAIEDASPLGAAMLAGIGVGVYRDEMDAYAAVRKTSREWEPDPERTRRYDGLFPLYRELSPALRQFSHAASDITRG